MWRDYWQVHAPRDAASTREHMQSMAQSTPSLEGFEEESEQLDSMTDVNVRTLLVMMDFMEHLNAEQLGELEQLFDAQTFEEQVFSHISSIGHVPLSWHRGS